MPDMLVHAPPFKGPRRDDDLLNTISLVGHALEQRMDQALGAIGLTARQHTALLHIASNPGLGRGSLGRLLRVSPQAAGALSRRLRDAGLIDYDDAVVVIASDRIADDRALDLWSTVEEALEHAIGRLVAVDLRTVTTFDAGSVDALLRLTHSAIRRRVLLCALMLHGTPLYDYLHRRQPIATLSVYSSLADALAAVEGPPT